MAPASWAFDGKLPRKFSITWCWIGVGGSLGKARSLKLQSLTLPPEGGCVECHQNLFCHLCTAHQHFKFTSNQNSQTVRGNLFVGSTFYHKMPGGSCFYKPSLKRDLYRPLSLSWGCLAFHVSLGHLRNLGSRCPAYLRLEVFFWIEV